MRLELVHTRKTVAVTMKSSQSEDKIHLIKYKSKNNKYNQNKQKHQIPFRT